MQSSETLYGTDRVVADALRERKRQVVVERFTRAGDDQHPPGRLALAAAAYALSWANVKEIERESGEAVAREALAEAGPHQFWPMDPQWWKPHNDRHDLIRAIALLIAEVEHIDRAADSHPRRPELTALDDQFDRDAHRVETIGLRSVRERTRQTLGFIDDCIDRAQARVIEPEVLSGCAVRAELQREATRVAQAFHVPASMTCGDGGPVSTPAVESSPPDCPADSGPCGGGE